ncbi:PREDICTED: uncharacterized protein LOC109177532 [Ipomoea nil]|uniref:uncharacterized protein LOC109177532 n=1 Tax=Ipomoea nil TaxID=35883 RepID=UPI000900BB5C|nr:PREDICTED: uncharacterized protein LOC109177532 [Ipomoea nil]
MEEDDERREAAIASAPSLRPNFRPTSGITSDQLSKFQELHRRRLQIKSRSKTKNYSRKGNVNGHGKSHGKDSNAKECLEHMNEEVDGPTEDLAVPKSSLADISSSQQDNTVSHNESSKRQKLHWGLDVKERWERKSNM